mmetsp:Transcript_733/g.1065  ORF Transcript_733/g.1065 Transcript_733/m.1065 type:complete len:289 (-) Transcript_733:114-980(-)
MEARPIARSMVKNPNSKEKAENKIPIKPKNKKNGRKKETSKIQKVEKVKRQRDVSSIFSFQICTRLAEKIIREEIDKQKRDPITLEDLGDITWAFINKDAMCPKGTAKFGRERSKTYYNVESLVQYLLKTGNFCEPITRLEFSLAQIKELKELGEKAGVENACKLIKIFENKNSPDSPFVQQKERREMLFGTDICIMDVVSDMRNIIENNCLEEGEVLLANLFEIFNAMFSTLYLADKDFAKQCMSHYQESLKGPPNRPTRDTEGLLKLTLKFMSDMNQREILLEEYY